MFCDCALYGCPYVCVCALIHVHVAYVYESQKLCMCGLCMHNNTPLCTYNGIQCYLYCVKLLFDVLHLAAIGDDVNEGHTQ